MQQLVRRVIVAGVGLAAFLPPMTAQAATVTSIVARVLWDGGPRTAAAGVSVEFGDKTGSEIKVSLFAVAASSSPHGFTEWAAANAELKELGAVPQQAK